MARSPSGQALHAEQFFHPNTGTNQAQIKKERVHSRKDAIVQRVIWPEVDLSLSRLAFGCAPIMGRVGLRVAMNAMAMAFERGVTHFDLARSYGFGEAERVVGGFIADKRDRVTIATKFGIQPARLTQAARLLKPTVRMVRRWMPALQGMIRRTSAATLVPGHYGLKDARRSVETSLRELRVEALDILFIHECTRNDDLQPELLSFLERLKHDGKIKTWGLAAATEEIAPVSRMLGVQPPTVQSPWQFTALPPPDQPRRILHSPFGAAKTLRLPNGGLPSQLVDWGRRHGIDADELQRRIPTLALQAAVVSNPQAVILCSMFTQSNISSNTSAIENLEASLAGEFARVVSTLSNPAG